MQTQPRDRDNQSEKLNSIPLNASAPKPHSAAPWQKAVGYLSLAVLGAGAAFSGSYFATQQIASQGSVAQASTPVSQTVAA